MKQLLVATAILALAATMAAQAQVTLRPGGAVVPTTPAVQRPGSEPVSSEVQLRELRSRLEALEKRFAELERKQAPDSSSSVNPLDPTRLRPQQPR
jgi:hypothetical protein